MPAGRENAKTSIRVTRKDVTMWEIWRDVPEGDDPKVFADELVKLIKEADSLTFFGWRELDAEETYSYDVCSRDGKR